jgi:hypothetical protein
MRCRVGDPFVIMMMTMLSVLVCFALNDIGSLRLADD